MIQRIIDIRTDGLAAFVRQSRRLVLALDYHNITIAMVDKETNQWMAVEVLQCGDEDFEDTALYLTELKRVSALFNYTGLDTHIYVRTTDALLIPSTLLDNAEEFVKLQFGLQPGEIVQTSRVDFKIDVAYKVKAQWVHAFKELFAKVEVSSTLALLTQQALASNEKFSKAIMKLVFTKGMAEITLVKNNRLLLAKCFRFHASDDLIYNLLNICRQLDIPQTAISINIQGLIDEKSPLYDSLHKYFEDVQFESTDNLAWGPAFKNVPAHYFTGLIKAS